MFKNPTPKQLAFYAALLTALGIFTAVIAINISVDSMDRALNIVFLPILAFAICFFACQYLIETFVYRRVKVIYKKISEGKKTDSPLAMSGDSLEDVENEVAEENDLEVHSQDIGEKVMKHLARVDQVAFVRCFDACGRRPAVYCRLLCAARDAASADSRRDAGGYVTPMGIQRC